MKEDIEEGIDSSRGGFEHPESEIVEHFYRAGNTIECAHAVFPVRSKSTGRWFPILLFFDQDEKKFAYAFRLNDVKQILSLIGLLFGCYKLCATRNDKSHN